MHRCIINGNHCRFGLCVWLTLCFSELKKNYINGKSAKLRTHLSDQFPPCCEKNLLFVSVALWTVLDFVLESFLTRRKQRLELTSENEPWTSMVK